MATVRHLGLFPHCLKIQDPAPQNDLIGNFSSPLNSAIDLFWRVKQMQFEVTASAYFSGNFPTVGATVDGKITITRAAKKETDLVCPYPWKNDDESINYGWIAEITDGPKSLPDDSEDFVPEDATGFSVSILNFGKPNWYDSFDKIVYMDTNFVFRYYNYSANAGPIARFTRRNAPETMFSAESFADYSLMLSENSEIKAKLYQLNGEYEDPNNGAITTATWDKFEFKVTEWWEYDPQDGLGPIYDKDTGRQLRPFPA